MTANLIAATTDPLPCFQFQGKSLLMCYWAASNHYSKLLVVQSSLIFFKFIHRECYPHPKASVRASQSSIVLCM